MLIHTVFFWLDRGLTPGDIESFEAGLASLADIPTVRFVQWGKPSATSRPVVDRTYSYGVAVHFDDLAGHDAYQVHPLHQEFLRRHSAKWLRVVIYDFE